MWGLHSQHNAPHCSDPSWIHYNQHSQTLNKLIEKNKMLTLERDKNEIIVNTLIHLLKHFKHKYCFDNVLKFIFYANSSLTFSGAVKTCTNSYVVDKTLDLRCSWMEKKYFWQILISWCHNVNSNQDQFSSSDSAEEECL